MEIQKCIKIKKNLYLNLIGFIEATDDSDEKFKELSNYLTEQEIFQQKEETLEIFKILSQISKNHHRFSGFYDKLIIILQFLFQSLQTQISSSEIIEIYEDDKRFLLLLFENKFISPDESILMKLMNKKDPNQFEYSHYLYGGIKEYMDEKDRKKIEDKILQNYNEDIETFLKKCRIGENDSYLCSLIRQDLVVEFITYINENNLSFLTKIKPSIYETNSFLIDKTPSMIKYAAFFGSIQIMQYLIFNRVQLKSSIWLYTIHSNNAELIHLLEQNEVQPKQKSAFFKFTFKSSNKRFDSNDYLPCMEESIKCHHNNISIYFYDNFLNNFQSCSAVGINKIRSTIINSFNYYFIPDDILPLILGEKNEYKLCICDLCFSFTSITIPSSITKIGIYAFSGCSTLKQITIPSTITQIDGQAFSGCSSLEQITIPSSITQIGFYAFSGCSSLLSIDIPDSVTSIGNGCFSSCTSLKEIKLPSTITIIGVSIFNDCKSLEKITIPSSVKRIDKQAFSGCSSLSQIFIPSSVKLFDRNIFDGVKNLEITGDVTKIEKFLFYNCTTLKRIVIPSSVTSFEESAFENCTSLDQITISSSSVISIGVNCFKCCKSLSQLKIPSSVIKIGNSSFFGCSKLKEIDIPSSVVSIGESVFWGCTSLENISIPSSVKEIGSNAFNGCSSLKQIEISSSATSIGNNFFWGCSSLKQISIPSSVTSIGNNAFNRCSKLEQISIPSSVVSIGNNAFYGCLSLSQIMVPSSIKSFGSHCFPEKAKIINV